MYEKHEELRFISFSIATVDHSSGVLAQCTKKPNQTKQKLARELRRAARELCFFPGEYPPFFPNIFMVPCRTHAHRCACGEWVQLHILTHSVRHQPALVSCSWACLCEQWFTAAGCLMWAEQNGTWRVDKLMCYSFLLGRWSGSLKMSGGISLVWHGCLSYS